MIYFEAGNQELNGERQYSNVPFVSKNATFIPNIVPPQTASQMIRIALAAVQDPEVSGFARWLVRNLADENFNSFASAFSEISAVYNWVGSHVRYTRDPIGVELVYTPQQMLTLIQRYGKWSEDCDTQLLLCLTLLLSIGRRCRMTIAGFHADKPDYFTHVFIEVLMPPIGSVGPRWVIVDPSIKGKVFEMAKRIKHKRHFYP